MYIYMHVLRMVVLVFEYLFYFGQTLTFKLSPFCYFVQEVNEILYLRSLIIARTHGHQISLTPCTKWQNGEHVQVYIHAYIHTYILTYHTYVCTYIHTRVHTYIHTYIHACIHTYIHMCTYNGIECQHTATTLQHVS